MSDSRQVRVNNEGDVINARLYTRQMAKNAGLNLMDQARISLAVSSMAHLLRLGDPHPGTVHINQFSKSGDSGMQVVWVLDPNPDSEKILHELDTSSIMLMVDHCDIQTAPNGGIIVTAVKRV